MNFLYKLNQYSLWAALISVPIVLVMILEQSRTYQGDMTCGYTGLGIVFLEVSFVWSIIFLFLNGQIKPSIESRWWNWLGLIFVFLLGVIPACLLVFSMFCQV